MTHECMICGVRVEVLFDPVGCAAGNREKGKNRRDRMCGFGSPLKKRGYWGLFLWEWRTQSCTKPEKISIIERG